MKGVQRQLVGFGWGFVFCPCKSWRWARDPHSSWIKCPTHTPRIRNACGKPIALHCHYNPPVRQRSGKEREKLTNPQKAGRETSKQHSKQDTPRKGSVLPFLQQKETVCSCRQLLPATLHNHRQNEAQILPSPLPLLKMDHRSCIDCA